MKSEQEAIEPIKAKRSYIRERTEKNPFENLPWTGAYLKTLRESGNVALACEAAKVTRGKARDAMAKSEAFALACQDAIEEYGDRLEAEADRRARLGWDEPVYQMGRLAGLKRVYDSRLMEKLLEGAKPAKFRSGIPGGGAALVFVERSSEPLSEAEWTRRHDPLRVRAARPALEAEVVTEAEGAVEAEDPSRDGGG